MFFRNLTLFRFPTTTKLDDLDTGLGECQLKPVGPLELSSRGFISPFGRDADGMSHNRGDATWLAVGGEDKILPGSVVNDMLAKKLAEIEQKEGRKPGGRTRKRLKDELITDLLPRAFVKPSRTDALIDLGHGVVVVDTSSRKTGENVVSEIRRALGSFPALPLNAEVAPRSILTGWVAGEPLPEGLSLGDECELRDPIDQGAVVKVQRMELQSDEITKHLESGKQVTRLALNLDDHVSLRARRGPGRAQVQAARWRRRRARIDRARRPARRARCALRADGGRVQAPVHGARRRTEVVQGRGLTRAPHRPHGGRCVAVQQPCRLSARMHRPCSHGWCPHGWVRAAFVPPPSRPSMPSLFRLLAPKPRTIERESLELELPDGRTIDLQRVRDPRARRLRLSVDERGARLTMPLRASLGDR